MSFKFLQGISWNEVGFCSLFSKFGRRKLNKVFQVFECNPINFTSDRQSYNLASHYNRINADWVHNYPRQVTCKQLIAYRLQCQGIEKYKQIWSSSSGRNNVRARYITFYEVPCFCCCSENIQDTCMLNVWFFHV